MATSTEATVRDVIVTALRAIAVTSLGFQDTNGNIRDYPIEFEKEELRTSYLSSTVAGRKVVRCWSVDVRAREEFSATSDNGIMTRFYGVTVKGYYDIGVGGEGYRDIIDHGRKVREAIRDLGIGLSGTVSRWVVNDEMSIGLEPAGASGNVIVGVLQYVFERANPDW